MKHVRTNNYHPQLKSFIKTNNRFPSLDEYSNMITIMQISGNYLYYDKKQRYSFTVNF